MNQNNRPSVPFLSRMLLLLALLLPTALQAANINSPLGINIREIRYWGTELHTVDFFKRAGNGANGIWLTQCAYPCNGANTWNTGEQAHLDLDAAGWPRSLPAASDSSVNYRWVTTILWMAGDKLPTGRWTVLYDGEGTLAYGQSGVTRDGAASTPGRDLFDVAPGTTQLTLSIRATDPNRTGAYLRNIRVIPPGGTCNQDPMAYAVDASACPASFRPFTQTYASEPFHPQFLSDLSPFAALRFTHFLSTNVNQNSLWSQRFQHGEISWGYDSNRGAPIEVALDIASALNASPWFNIPAMADDDYMLQHAQLARSRLTTARPIYIEYGNEVWNGTYPYSIAGQWVRDQGRARWPASAESDFAKQMNWFALRTKQMCAIWKTVFADQPGRVRCVMGAQGANSWVTDHYILSCPLHAAEPGGTSCDAAAGIDAVAGGYYIGSHINDPAFEPEIQSEWFTAPDGGLAQLFQEITDGTALTTPDGWNRARATVAGVGPQMAANKQVADAHGVEMVTYEGGNELFGRDASSYQSALQALAVEAQGDLRMGAAYTAVLNQWKANGGHLYMVYESTGPYSTARGNSTLLEWQGQPRLDAPKYDAVLAFIENNACWWNGCPGPSYTLTVTRSGSGSITSSPAGISCGSDCSESYAPGRQVTLTATPAPGYRFAGWSGACTGSATCTVTMSAARSVTATFTSASATKGDLNGDGRADILWHNATTGGTDGWLMNGLTRQAMARLFTSTAWAPVASGDLNGDGNADILWYNPSTGATDLWLMNGLSRISTTRLFTSTAWRPSLTADVDGDGKEDIIWYNATTGRTDLWLMNGNTMAGFAVLFTSTAWQVVAAGDVDGDGKDDLIWNNAATGQTDIWLMNGRSRTSVRRVLTNAAWKPVASGDLDGDGKDDILWYNQTIGGTDAWLMNGLYQRSLQRLLTRVGWQPIGARDLSGDGKADIVWNNATTGQTSAWIMDGYTLSAGAELLRFIGWIPLGK